MSNEENERVGDEKEKRNELNWDCSSLEKSVPSFNLVNSNCVLTAATDLQAQIAQGLWDYLGWTDSLVPKPLHKLSLPCKNSNSFTKSVYIQEDSCFELVNRRWIDPLQVCTDSTESQSHFLVCSQRPILLTLISLWTITVMSIIANLLISINVNALHNKISNKAANRW